MISKNGKKLGRPRTADERNRRQDGNPILHVRLAGDVFDEVKSLGGVTWVRELIMRELGRECKTVGGKENVPRN